MKAALVWMRGFDSLIYIPVYDGHSEFYNQEIEKTLAPQLKLYAVLLYTSIIYPSTYIGYT